MEKAICSNPELLDQRMHDSGLKTGYICKMLGISRQAFHKKKMGMTALRKSEVYTLCSLLGIKNEEPLIFSPEVEKKVDEKREQERRQDARELHRMD